MAAPLLIDTFANRMAKCCSNCTRVAGSNTATRTESGDWIVSGLVRCGMWACPGCVGAKARKAQAILSLAVERHLTESINHAVMMMTLTVPHHRSDNPRVLMERLYDSRARFQKSRPWKRFADELGIEVIAGARDDSFGGGSFHPHFHVAVFANKARMFREGLVDPPPLVVRDVLVTEDDGATLVWPPDAPPMPRPDAGARKRSRSGDRNARAALTAWSRYDEDMTAWKRRRDVALVAWLAAGSDPEELHGDIVPAPRRPRDVSRGGSEVAHAKYARELAHYETLATAAAELRTRAYACRRENARRQDGEHGTPIRMLDADAQSRAVMLLAVGHELPQAWLRSCQAAGFEIEDEGAALERGLDFTMGDHAPTYLFKWGLAEEIGLSHEKDTSALRLLDLAARGGAVGDAAADTWRQYIAAVDGFRTTFGLARTRKAFAITDEDITARLDELRPETEDPREPFRVAFSEGRRPHDAGLDYPDLFPLLEQQHDIAGLRGDALQVWLDDFMDRAIESVSSAARAPTHEPDEPELTARIRAFMLASPSIAPS